MWLTVCNALILFMIILTAALIVWAAVDFNYFLYTSGVGLAILAIIATLEKIYALGSSYMSKRQR